VSQPDTGLAVGATAEADAAGLQLLASIGATLGKVQAELQWQRDRVTSLAASITPINNIAAPAAFSTGIIKSPDTLGPKTGQAWIVRRMTAANFTGGTVAVFLDNHNAPQNQLVTFTQAGTFLFGNKQIILTPGQQLVVNTSAATGGTVMFSIDVVQVALIWLPDHLL